ncbi:MAG: YraN family protein [Opitutales bacterium]|nr:YraN family protein [Opitutales bacterium]
MFSFWQKKSAGSRQTVRQKVGAKGESLAAEFLRQKKIRVFARNWSDGRHELDLLAWEGEVLVVIEVKTRTKEGLVPARSAVDRQKKAAVRKGVYHFLRTLRHKPKAIRFDIVEVIQEPLDGEPGPVVRHYSHIPLFSKHFRPG